tara:strand:- start:24691 stop:26292 length:1602 start_codon:yes stop_codon:yes gene_type:complete
MPLSEFSSSDSKSQWDRFCDLLWYNENLGIWLDISRMNINTNDLQKLNPSIEKALVSMQELERGSIANKDEGRQVGHYWLRNPTLAPNETVMKDISNQILDIENFGREVLDSKIKNNNDNKFTDVLWIGIGGSGLGPLLIVESLQDHAKGLDFHFLDNIDTDGISKKLKSIGNRILTTLIVVVSKSGGTPEPQICMELTRSYLCKFNGDWSSQSIAITMKDSKLDKLAIKEKWLRRFDMPDWVGGRTSITAAVGNLPIALIGSDINDFLDGASKMDVLTRDKNINNNPAALLAIAWLIAGKGKGLRDMVILPYKDSLQVFSRYLQQLIMESLGKKEDRLGNIVNQGISVYGNKGSTDQHAYVQQLRDGIDNFFVTFIEVLKNKNDLDEQKPGDYLSGFLQGTRNALTQGDRQNLTITIKEFNESSLGALIALFERAVGIYGELVNINAYHQPGVEAGKKAASEIIDLQTKIQALLSDGKTRTITEINKSINNSNKESIFWILRHMSLTNNLYISNGEWNSPDSLSFKYSPDTI